MPHCAPCKYDPRSIACYASTRPRLCVLIHTYGRTDYEASVDELTLNPPPPPPPPEAEDDPPRAEGGSNPFVAARRAMIACPCYRRSCTGCDGGVCSRADKAGPTDLARCAECLGTPLPPPKPPAESR